MSTRPEPTPAGCSASEKQATSSTVRIVIEIETSHDEIPEDSLRAILDTVRSAVEPRVRDVSDVTDVGVSILGAPHTTSSIRGVYDRRTQDLIADGSHSRLTPREATVLSYLLDRPGETVTRDDLQAAIDDAGGSLGPRAIDVVVSRIRAKLPWPPELVITVRGIGYRFRPSAHFLILGDFGQERQP